MKHFSGIVTSDKMNNTVVVEVKSFWTHPIYKKTISRTKKYLVHNDLNAKVGDAVVFGESKPLSKLKRFKLVSIVNNEAK